MMTSIADSTKSCHRLNTIRAGFVSQGTSLHAWCRQNGVDTSNAYKAISGKWSGAKAERLVAVLAAAAGASVE